MSVQISSLSLYAPEDRSGNQFHGFDASIYLDTPFHGLEGFDDVGCGCGLAADAQKGPPAGGGGNKGGGLPVGAIVAGVVGLGVGVAGALLAKKYLFKGRSGGMHGFGRIRRHRRR